MVKCTKRVDNVQCTKTAFYGVVYSSPLFCKEHKRAKDISVKKKCEECDYAVVSEDTRCSRCSSVYNSIDEFKNMKIKELNDAIASEKSPSEFAAVINRPATPGAQLKKSGRKKRVVVDNQDESP